MLDIGGWRALVGRSFGARPSTAERCSKPGSGSSSAMNPFERKIVHDAVAPWTA